MRGRLDLTSSRSTRRAGLLLGLAVVLSMTLAACGGDDGDDAADTGADATVPAGDPADPADETDDATDEGAADEGAADGGGDDEADAAGSACEAVSVEQVTELFGKDATVDVERATECLWISEAGEGGLHQLHLQLYTGEDYYGPGMWAGTSGEPDPIDGLGDEAFLVRQSGLGTTAGYRDGDDVVFLNYQILLAGQNATGEKADQVVELLRQVAG